MSGVNNMNDRQLYDSHTDIYQITHARTETFIRLHSSPFYRDGQEKERVMETDKVQKKVPKDKNITVSKQKVAEKENEAEPRRFNTEGADKVQKKAPKDENMTVCKQKVAEKEKEAEPRTDTTEGQCLTICIKAKFLKNTQHKCRICKQTVSQICSCNVEDPLSDNPQHRIHKKNCKPLKLFECTKCGKTAISKEALECHMRSIHRPDLDFKKCTEELLRMMCRNMFTNIMLNKQRYAKSP